MGVAVVHGDVRPAAWQGRIEDRVRIGSMLRPKASPACAWMICSPVLKQAVQDAITSSAVSRVCGLVSFVIQPLMATSTIRGPAIGPPIYLVRPASRQSVRPARSNSW